MQLVGNSGPWRLIPQPKHCAQTRLDRAQITLLSKWGSGVGGKPLVRRALAETTKAPRRGGGGSVQGCELPVSQAAACGSVALRPLFIRSAGRREVSRFVPNLQRFSVEPPGPPRPFTAS